MTGGTYVHVCSGIFWDTPLLVRLVTLHVSVLVREHRRLVARVRQNLVRRWLSDNILGIAYIRPAVSVLRYRSQRYRQRRQ